MPGPYTAQGSVKISKKKDKVTFTVTTKGEALGVGKKGEKIESFDELVKRAKKAGLKLPGHSKGKAKKKAQEAQTTTTKKTKKKPIVSKATVDKAAQLRKKAAKAAKAAKA